MRFELFDVDARNESAQFLWEVSGWNITVEKDNAVPVLQYGVEEILKLRLIGVLFRLGD